jgi:hypothetical protein
MESGTGPNEATAAETTRRNRLAAEILQEYLDGRFLPPFIPGEPRSLGAALGAAAVEPEILGMLAGVYGVGRWDLDSFKRYVLEGAIPAWKRDTTVIEQEGVLKIRSRMCPFAPDAKLDPRICDMCRLTQQMLVQGAARGEIADTAFTHTVAKGDAGCDLIIRRKEKQ